MERVTAAASYRGLEMYKGWMVFRMGMLDNVAESVVTPSTMQLSV